MQKELLFRLFEYGNRMPQKFNKMCEYVDYAIRTYGASRKPDEFWREKTDGQGDDKLYNMDCSWVDFRNIMGGLDE